MSRDTNPPSVVRLDPAYTLEEIPAHPELSSGQNPANCPQLQIFIANLLNTAINFAENEIPSFNNAKSKKSKGSNATVSLVTWQRGTEHWVARLSSHSGKAEPGDAIWHEFECGLKHNHSQNEKDYTPTVVDAHQVCNWSSHEIGQVVGWRDVDMGVYEMKHKMPSILEDRIFTILILTAYPSEITAQRSFLTVTVPLTLTSSNIQSSRYQNCPSVVHGAYASVERVYEEAGQIVWVMATTSNAKGVLPITVQKLGVPGAITKDVGFLLEWLNTRRKASDTIARH